MAHADVCDGQTKLLPSPRKKGWLSASMVVSSTLVSVSDDADQRLVSLMEAHNVSCSSGEAIVSDKAAMKALVSTDMTAQDAMAAVVILVKKTKDNSLVNAIVQVEKEDSAQRKIVLLSVIYNMRSNVEEKLSILLQMFQLVDEKNRSLIDSESALGNMLGNVITKEAAQQEPSLVTMLNSWNVDAGKRRDLYRCIVSILPVQDLRRQRFLILLVESYDNSSNVDDAGLSAARDASIGVMRDPVTLFMLQRHLLSRPAIQALEKKDAALFGLFKIFQEGSYAEYKTYIGQHSSLLSKLGLEQEDCERHMRVLTMCSLALDHQEEISYKSVADALQLTGGNAEVERWVVAAVGTGLLQAKMDQLKETVLVERSVVRRFDMDQWKSIQTRLSSWKDNVKGIMTALEQSQAAVQQAAVN